MRWIEILKRLVSREDSRTDVDLVNAWVKNKDEDAYSALYYRYYASILSFISKNFSSDIAEDAAQHVFSVLAEEKISEQMEEAKVKSLFFTISRNYALKETRKSNRFSSLDEKIEEGFEPASDMDILDAAIWKQYNQYLSEFLSELRPDYREVIYLRVVENFTPMEISKIINVEVKKVRNMLYLANEELRNKFLKIQGERNG